MLRVEFIIFFAALLFIVLLTMRKASQERKERLKNEWEEDEEDEEVEDAWEGASGIYKKSEERSLFVKKEDPPIKEEKTPLIVNYVKQLPSLKQMVIYQEILGKPVSLRGLNEPYESE
mgnify:CR=1 FL=1